MAQLGPVSSAMIDRLEIAQQQQHLDIAAGTGEPGLSIATSAPKGHVVLTDLSVEMLDIAARRAIAQGILNFETRVCSADNLPFDDATFDSVSVRFGYMFFPAVAAATAEFVRVLKPGGAGLCVGLGRTGKQSVDDHRHGCHCNRTCSRPYKVFYDHDLGRPHHRRSDPWGKLIPPGRGN